MKAESKGIVSWPEGERPCERLLRLGPQALTDAKLLAILLRIGFQGASAVELGRNLVRGQWLDGAGGDLLRSNPERKQGRWRNMSNSTFIRLPVEPMEGLIAPLNIVRQLPLCV